MSEIETNTSTAEDSDATTVSMGDERSNNSSFFEARHVDIADDSFMLSEIENSIEHSIEEQQQHQEGKEEEISIIKQDKKVNVTDIFNRLKPSKIRKLEEEQVQDPEVLDYPLPVATPIDSEPVPKVQYGVTARDLLTGNPSKKSKKKDIKKDKHIEEVPITLVDDETFEELEPKPKSGITAKDLLTGKPSIPSPVPRSSTPIPEDAEMIELVTSDEEEDITTKDSKGTKKKRKYQKRDKEPKQSLMITLKYKPHKQRIADLESKIRKSMTSSVSAKDLFKRFDKKKEEPKDPKEQPSELKQEHLITLKLSPTKLKTIKSPVNDDVSLFTKGTTHVNGAKSYLDLLSYKPIVAKNPIYKLKELQPPIIPKESMHVTYDSIPIQHRTITLPKKHELITEDLDYSLIDRRSIKTEDLPIYNFNIIYSNDEDLEQLIRSKIPNIDNDSRFKKFLKITENPNNSLWTTFFKPESPSEILFEPKIVENLQRWLKNSFQILKKKTKRPNLKKLRKNNDDEMDDFIVDEDDEETDDEAFVPIMILKGPEGVGKSSAIYSLVENLSGYVYEINASQSRGRKDIMTTLTELSTTQLVQNSNQNSNDFQKGAILFEDVDILFESDRGFWNVMEHVLTISRRPIILTCKDSSMIPENILECSINENSFFEIPKQSLDDLANYLWLMGLTKKINLDDQLILDLIYENSMDLRKCISALQVLCEISCHYDDDPNQLINLQSKPKINPPKIQDETSLDKIAQLDDCYSISDMIQTVTKSFINHEIIENEVLSNEIYLNEEELKTSPLPFEYNLGKDFESQLPEYPYDNLQNGSKYIKKLDELFWKSKLKIVKRITRQSAYSMFDFNETSSDVQNVFNLPTSIYTTEISPVFRSLSRNETKIDNYNNELIAQHPDKKIDELLRERILIPKNFQVRSDTLLYGPLRYWNV
ncbi:putative Lon protease, mitochondrial [Wickerhamomyces ciferrii]|uniref:Lon protease, mitochondrial n=1 Tax=Wickerhamomyces ciferrii (strain ATCC 14091 / BCRC 22168 / CBS 111 / JCM 3599 / NBRC 0793 / NRRL Y-1031 F-60-10) TaxID=1206466 RepID=K0KXA0_WICCF|nr:putative Lon protease, mitochondrial [Wickerhamomyces ciferrii]CCH46109.1 putative Lon protease, mitochondrial [Wickerhamomyces ciferrii]